MTEVETAAEEKGKHWSRLRECIVHEDNLVNHRLMWLLTIEGFLLTGFVFAQNGILSRTVSTWSNVVAVGIEALLGLIFLGAAWTCYITGVNLSMAHAHALAVRSAWHASYDAEQEEGRSYPRWFWGNPEVPAATARAGPADGPQYPPIMGKFGADTGKGVRNYVTASARIPFILFLVNLAVVLACAGMIFGLMTGKGAPVDKARIEVQRDVGGARFKMTLESEKPSGELVKDVESMLRALDASGPTTRRVEPDPWDSRPR